MLVDVLVCQPTGEQIIQQQELSESWNAPVEEAMEITQSDQKQI